MNFATTNDSIDKLKKSPTKTNLIWVILLIEVKCTVEGLNPWIPVILSRIYAQQIIHTIAAKTDVNGRTFKNVFFPEFKF